MPKLVRWSTHLLVLGAFINNGIFTFGTGNQVIVSLISSYLLVSFVLYAVAMILTKANAIAEKMSTRFGGLMIVSIWTLNLPESALR